MNALPYVTLGRLVDLRLLKKPITTITRYAWLPVDATRSANKPTCDIWIMRHKLRLRSKLACFEFDKKVCSTRATIIILYLLRKLKRSRAYYINVLISANGECPVEQKHQNVKREKKQICQLPKRV